MITNWLKSTFRFFDSVSSELEYWQQIENLQSKVDKAEFELQKMQDAFKREQDYSCFMALRASEFEGELEDLKNQLGDSNAGYTSLLRDYFEAADKHRQFKRESLARIEELENQVHATHEK